VNLIRLLGGAAVEGPDGPLSGREVQRARLALLALLATSRKRSVARERLAALLWPESDSDRARGLLRDSVYRLREALGNAALVGAANELRLDPRHVRCDVWEFEDALDRGDWEEADRLYTGPFLDGFFLSDAPEFERWADNERARLASLHVGALESLAIRHAERTDWNRAVKVWRRLAGLEPHSARIALALMTALDAAGDRAAAIKHAAVHAETLRAELDIEADANVAAFAERLRVEPVSRRELEVDTTGPVSRTIREPASDASSMLGASPDRRPEIHERRRRARTLFVGMAALTFTLATISAWWYTAAPPMPALDPNVIAVLPFRVTSPDSANNYLREGVVDVLGAFLTGDGGPRAVDTRAVLSAYRRARGTDGGELTTSQMLVLARRLGAGQMLTGELIAGGGEAAMSARIFEVPSGRTVAQHVERGKGDHLLLTTRVASALLAKSFGEGVSRIGILSDSMDAVRAYLAGMRAYRDVDARAAFEHFSRALQIDPLFAPAALWRAYVAWGAFIFGTNEKRSADSAAWALRGRMVKRDSLALASLPSIGPNYPDPSTALDVIRAQERAAHANPDRVEVWDAWAHHLVTFGTQAEIERSLDLAASVVDSAIAIDSGFVPALSLRMQVALLKGDRRAIREHSDRYFAALGDTSRGLHWRFAVAYMLGDSARLPSLLEQLAKEPGFAWQNIELWALKHGFSSIEHAERMATMRLAAVHAPAERNAAIRSVFRVATARGRARDALAWADSMPETPGQALITLALLGLGYDSAANAVVRSMEARLATVQPSGVDAHGLCYAQLYRVAHDDTSTTRRDIGRMRSLTKTIDAAPGWRVGRLDLCPQLLEAALEQRRRPTGANSPALNRVEKLVRQGPQAEQPGNLARLMIAGWREAQGDYRAALAVVRGRDPMAWHVASPAAWRIEGRLAALAGDTVGAVRAYRKFLALRDRPDSGAISGEVQQVMMELARLGGDQRQQSATRR
jgi:DNA-binding SARP family transcriptional activator